MNTNESSSHEKDEYLQRSLTMIRYTLTLVNDYLIVLDTLFAEYEKNKYIFDISPCFFGVVRSCIISNLFIEMSKLFDINSDSLSIFNLVGHIRKTYPDLRFISDTHNILKKANNNALENLRKQRNVFYAHIDKETTEPFTNLPYTSPVSIGDMKLLADHANAVVKLIDKSFDDSSQFVYFHVNCRDLSSLISYIQHIKNVAEMYTQSLPEN